jgi:hypothetical protein
MLTPDGTGDPSLHVFKRHIRESLWFALGFVRGGNSCPDILQRVRASTGNNQPAFGVQAPDQAVPGMNVEQLPHNFGNGELSFAGESAFSDDLHEALDFEFPYYVLRVPKWR